MKQNFTVRQGALDGVQAFLSVAERRTFRRAARLTRKKNALSGARWPADANDIASEAR
jgi:hypothetical protein